MSESITVTVNGEPRDVPAGSSVAELLQRLELQPKYVAVERNRELVPRGDHAQTVLCNGDVLEVVTLVGGG